MRILILKLGAIGDTVMALGMITAIDEKYPEAEITWICGKSVEPILASVSRINNLIVIDDAKFYKGTLQEKLSVVFRLWKKIFFNQFDLVLNCYRNSIYRVLLFPVIKKVYREFSGKTRENSFIPGRYHANEYCRVLIGHDNYQEKTYRFPKLNITEKEELINQLNQLPHPRIVLAPGGAKNFLRDDDLRRWPIENYAALADDSLSKNKSIILIGSDSDKWVLDKFTKKNICNLIGMIDLLDLIVVFNHSDVLVTHDTGVLHLAKLSKIKIVALFGPVNPLERIGIGENVKQIWEGANLPCSPCYDGRDFAPCSSNICMKKISVNSVIELI